MRRKASFMTDEEWFEYLRMVGCDLETIAWIKKNLNGRN